VTDTPVRKADGTPWRNRPSDHRGPFIKVVNSVGLPGVTLYALRHSSITRQLLAGVPIRVIAASHDTSAREIERTYSLLITDHATP
jgi:hypothetical protein